MNAFQVKLKDAYYVCVENHYDPRGSFCESFNQQQFNELTNTNHQFVQDNISYSYKRGTLRGLHHQKKFPQGKLIRVLDGLIYDVIVDLRKSSPTCGKFFGMYLRSSVNMMLWVPPGFAHGFITLEDNTRVMYKVTDYYHPEDEHVLAYDDKTLAIEWNMLGVDHIITSDRDRLGTPLEQNLVE